MNRIFFIFVALVLMSGQSLFGALVLVPIDDTATENAAVNTTTLLNLHPQVTNTTNPENDELTTPYDYYEAKIETDKVPNTTAPNSLLGLTLRYGVLSLASMTTSGNATNEQGPDEVFSTPKIEGKPLAYPNPFRQETGTTIGYMLSADMDIKLEIYDMIGTRIFRNHYPAGSPGGHQGYNRLKLDLASFKGHELSSGVYSVLVIYNGKVLGKTKMAAIP